MIYGLIILLALPASGLKHPKLTNTTIASTTDTTTITAQSFTGNKIVNRHDFKYILNPRFTVCGGGDGLTNQTHIFVLVYVHSAPENFKRRLSLRETWARRSMFKRARFVFMMGYPKTGESMQEKLKLESDIYKDIVQEDFLDAYRNITYKGIMAMKWITEFCPVAKYILKVDDDIIANFFILLRHLKSLGNHNLLPARRISCLVWVGMPVMRDKDSKWYIPPDEFKAERFGDYCSGSAYILTRDLPALMFNASLYTKFFWVDDFYMTGLLARAVNASYQFLNSMYIINTYLVEQRFTGKEADYTAFGHLPGQLNKVYQLWTVIMRNQLARFPSLYRPRAAIVNKVDFLFIRNFRWKMSVWDKYLKASKATLDNNDYYNSESAEFNKTF